MSCPKIHFTIVFVLTVIQSWLPLHAQEVEEAPKIDVAKPFAYSLSLMAVGLPSLMGAGAYENGASVDHFTDAFKSAPRFEGDTLVFNYLLHPLWGSETYLRAREANWGMAGSIGFSMGMSVTWEYLMESWVTHPSANDLIFTTGVGWMIGNYAIN